VAEPPGAGGERAGHQRRAGDGELIQDASHTEAQGRLTQYVAALGRGPGRSRALSRAEARDACRLMLEGLAAPEQVGALLMLLRYRGEDADEVAGLVDALRDHAGIAGAAPMAELDWPSYGAGRTRGAPWFLLAALAVARNGVGVLMHGTNDFSAGQTVEQALAALGMAPTTGLRDAGRRIEATGFAFLPLRAFAPALERLLGLRALLGLRSPLNTAARLLNPGNAPAGVDGVFHPPYVAVHLEAAERLERSRLLVLKGGGGEAERNPAKPLAAQLRSGARVVALTLPPLPGAGPLEPVAIEAVWDGTAQPPAVLAVVRGTIALALLASGRCDTPEAADQAAPEIWARRAG
jgi:anthranilate phosphoribosyltransferase